MKMKNSYFWVKNQEEWRKKVIWIENKKFKTFLYNALTQQKNKESRSSSVRPDSNWIIWVKSRRPRWDGVWSRQRKRRVQELNAIFNSFCSVRLCLVYRLWPLHINSTRRRRRRRRRQQKRWLFIGSSIPSEGNKTQRFGESSSNTLDQFPRGRRAPKTETENSDENHPSPVVMWWAKTVVFWEYGFLCGFWVRIKAYSFACSSWHILFEIKVKREGEERKRGWEKTKY